MAQVRVPNEFFAKSKLEYSNWRWAFFRELIQNSYDAGASKIDFYFESSSEDQTHTISCKDNGFGMDQNTLENVLLCLGGSLKPDGAIGGFGYAKSLLFFAHLDYEIRTKSFLVKGSGGDYQIEAATTPVSGTLVKVRMAMEGMQQLDFMNILYSYAKHLTVEKPLAITLNGLKVESVFSDYEYLVKTRLGDFSFKEITGFVSCSKVAVSVRGLPMFVQNVYSSGDSKFEGLLELEGNTFDLLTANRDSLKHGHDSELTKIIQKMLEERTSLKLGKSVNIKLNYSSPQGLTAGDNTGSSSHSLEIGSNASACGIEHLLTNVDYPSNFPLRLHSVVSSARAKSDSTAVSVPEVLKLLKKSWVRSLALEWKRAVYSVLSTQAMYDRGVRYQEGTVAKDAVGARLNLEVGEFYVGTRRISAGFVLAKGIEGLNVRPSDSGEDILILCNPNSYDKSFIVGDLNDLAIHECAHLTVSGHNETFVDEDMQLRRSLRRRVLERKAGTASK